MSRFQKLKQELSELTFVQIASYVLQLIGLIFCLHVIYLYQTGMDFEMVFDRNKIDHFVFITLGLVVVLWARGLGEDDKKSKE